MAVETGVLAGLAFVLVSAAWSKLGETSRNSSRLRSLSLRHLLAIGELALAVVVVGGPAEPAGVLLTGAFAVFAVVHVRRWRMSRGEDCGCFGDSGPSGIRQISLSVASAAAAGAVTTRHPASLVQLATTEPVTAAFVAAAAAGAAWVWRQAFIAGVARQALLRERLVSSSALFLERRMSRRTMLVRLATAGSALTVAPLRYLLYPGTALAAIGPGNCSSGLCTDGWTAFCCEINQGSNTCPPGTFAGGWWMCTDYTGRQLCHHQGVRYYVDCNQTPGDYRAGPCRCAHDNCAYRRVACNVFRYGQCNPQISGVTPVVCRMVVCENPSTISSLNCGSSVAVENRVCGQDVPCLEPPAHELAGAGGV